MLDVRRLQRMLASDGFDLGWEGRDDASALVRRSPLDNGLFELLIVGWAGRSGEALFADAAVSVISRLPTKGLVEVEQLTEIDSDHERRWSIIRARKDAEAWQDRLARIAPERCLDCAIRLGPGLLARTQRARMAAQRYLAHIPAGLSQAHAVEWLRSKCSTAERAESDRLRGWPGVLQVEGGELVYEAATLLLAHFMLSVEEDAASLLAEPDPLRNPELMWRIQLLRDRLAGVWPASIALA